MKCHDALTTEEKQDVIINSANEISDSTYILMLEKHITEETHEHISAHVKKIIDQTRSLSNK